MDYRLTLDERCSLAEELRTFILQRENPRQLASIEDQETRPAPQAARLYPFEFFLDRYRDWVRKGVEKIVAYSVGWCGGAISRDEQTRSFERIARMTSEMASRQLMEDGVLDRMTDHMSRTEFEGCGIESTRIKLFLFEVFYELVREYASICVREAWNSSK